MSNPEDPIYIKDDEQQLSPFFAGTDESPRTKALEVLRRIKYLGEGKVDLQKIAEFETLKLNFVQIPEKNTGARLVQTKADWYIDIDNGGTSENAFSRDKTRLRRQRFSLSHELGHYYLESHCNVELQKALLSGLNPHSKYYLKKREHQANEFASELLLPFQAIKSALKYLDFRDDFFSSVDSIAERFEASLTATVKRIASIIDIPVIAIHFAPDGRSYQLPSYSKDFQEAKFFFERDRSIPYDSYVSRMFDSKTDGRKGRKVHPDCSVWFPNRKKNDYKVIEWAVNLEPYGFLVFLELIELDW